MFFIPLFLPFSKNKSFMYLLNTHDSLKIATCLWRQLDFRCKRECYRLVLWLVFFTQQWNIVRFYNRQSFPVTVVLLFEKYLSHNQHQFLVILARDWSPTKFTLASPYSSMFALAPSPKTTSALEPADSMTLGYLFFGTYTSIPLHSSR